MNAVVRSVDEKTSVQAKARVNPKKPAVPGFPERREFEYERNGTVVLFASLNVHQGDVSGRVTDSTCRIGRDMGAWTCDGLVTDAGR